MPRPAGQTALAMLGEDGRAEAHRRWLVLRAHVEDGVPLTRVAAQSGILHRTFQRWLARYRAGGLAGLGRTPRSDRDRSRPGLMIRPAIAVVTSGLPLGLGPPGPARPAGPAPLPALFAGSTLAMFVTGAPPASSARPEVLHQELTASTAHRPRAAPDRCDAAVSGRGAAAAASGSATRTGLSACLRRVSMTRPASSSATASTTEVDRKLPPLRPAASHRGRDRRSRRGCPAR